jgi:glucose-1-phosphate cytidylyltransferase
VNEVTRAVILAGGMGTRIREETEFKPKPMVEIGGMPILWHIMKNLHSQGVREFVICLGYKGDQIKTFFQNYDLKMGDLHIDAENKTVRYLNPSTKENWKVTLVDTGLDTMTGGRLYKVREHLKGEPFLCTYGDGLADINLEKLWEFHRRSNKIATVTAAHPATRFGNLIISKSGVVTEFSEKPPSDEWVNAGFFIFEEAIFKYLDSDCVLEQSPLKNLVSHQELSAYKHDGFWRPMDTYRESKELNELFMLRQAPWVNWRSNGN